ncbi:hypothetical protein JCM10908_002691 [Rhodotorula pacifica]|uniref:uncharacterized protein n=1 Tax=Rhodotorula pacifica TaxID=1495444 RepID=UPI003181AB03
MPHTLPPVNLETLVAHPVIPQGHGQPGYTTGDEVPAIVGDSKPHSPSTSRPSSRPGSRSHSPFRHDSFFKRGSNTAGSQEREQREAIARQVGTAQDATYEADLERAIRRSKRDEEDRRRRTGEAPSQERSDSHARGLSRIRAAIKELVNDPFWHRTTKAESEHQEEYMKRVILDEVHAARASTDAGSRDRAARSRSRVRSPLASRNVSHDRKHQPHEASPLHGTAGVPALAPPVPDMPNVPKTEIPSTTTTGATHQTAEPTTHAGELNGAQVGELTPA